MKTKITLLTILLAWLSANPGRSAQVTTTTYSNSGFTVDTSQDLVLNMLPTTNGHTGSLVIPTLTNGQAPTQIPGYDGNNLIQNGCVLTFDMGAAATVNEIQTYSTWPDGGRVLQDYTVDVSLDGGTWTTGVVSVVNQGTGNSGSWPGVEVAVTTDDSSPLANNVRYIRFNFPSTQNGGVGYQEFVVNGVSFGLPEAPVFTEIPLDQTVTEGDSVTFTAQATGFPVPTIAWHFIDSGSVDHTLSTVGNTLTFTSNLSSAGQYYAVATNSAGTLNSTPAAVLTVNPNPVVATASYSDSGFTVDTSQDLALNVLPSASGNIGTTNLLSLSDGQAPNSIPGYDGQNTFNNGVVLTFDLGSEATINEIQSYSAWPGDRYRQDYTVDFSQDGLTWDNSVIAVVNQGTSPIGSWNNVKVSVVRNDSLPLANNARYVRFNFNNQQNGAVGYTEFVINGIPFALPEAPAFAEIPQSQTVTSGNRVTFTAQATGYPIPTITWHFIDSSSVNHLLPTVGSTLRFTSHLSSAGQYYAVASNSEGTVNSTPAAVLTVNPGIVENGDFSENAASFTEGNSYFAAQSPGNPVSATAWTGGSGINGTLGSAPDYFGPANHSIPSYLFMQGTQTVTQTITTTVGKSYLFSFKAACRENNTVGLTVWADNTQAPNLIIPDGGLSGTSFQTYSFNFTGSGTQTIQFVNSGTGDFTADLTEVSVTDLGWADPFAAWINGLDWSAFTSPDKTATGDPDGDGMNNQQEFAFGLDPRFGSSVNPLTQSLNPATGTFKYTRTKASGLSYVYQYSTTLSEPWDAFVSETPLPDSVSISDTVEEVTVTVPAALLNANSTLFVRVKAQ
ncbi:MAG: immunoglobulin domain-containing protein [Verrucomicrobia bacterium]|nr:immunoglobulin domain-containing protein [Verrucomicrobiota bacterium]